jgi:hypothetical protein
MNVHFLTEEVAVARDLAYEHGTYTLKVTDKATGQTLQDVKNKHVHILKRELYGSWKTWRMMVNSAEPPERHPAWCSLGLLRCVLKTRSAGAV